MSEEIASENVSISQRTAFDAEPRYISFLSNNGREIAVITPEGKFQRGKDFDSNDEAAAAFMTLIEKLFYLETTQLRQRIAELEQKIVALG